MGAKKISAQTAATLPLDGTETVPLVQGGATRRAQVREITKRLIPNVFDWDGASFAARFNAATAAVGAAGGGSLWIPPGSWTHDQPWDYPYGNLHLFSPTRQGARINFTYTGANPTILLGGTGPLNADRKYVIRFQDLYLTGALGQRLCRTRNLRGFHLEGCKVVADGWLELGDAAIFANPSGDKANGEGSTYIYEERFCEFNQRGVDTGEATPATLDFISAEYFSGQFESYHSFTEADTHASGLAGFTNRNNRAARIDDMRVFGGYRSRFDTNWQFFRRATNVRVIGHHCEGAKNHAYHFETLAGDAIDVAKVGWEHVQIIGGAVDAVNEAVVFRAARAGTNSTQSFRVSQLRSTGSSGTKTPVLIEATVDGALLHDFSVVGLEGLIKPADASQDGVRITGRAATVAVNGHVDDLKVESGNSTKLRSQLRVDGAGNRDVRAGHLISRRLATAAIDDQSGVLNAAGRQRLQANRTYYVDPATGNDANDGLATGAGNAFATVQAAWNAVAALDLNGKTATIQLADATYTAGVVTSPTLQPTPMGGGLIVIQGNAATPSNVLFQMTSVIFGFGQATDCRIRIKDMKLKTTSGASSHCINVAARQNLQYANIEFDACTGSHLFASAPGAEIVAQASYKITGGAVAHINSGDGGRMLVAGVTVTVSNTPVWSTAFAIGQRGGLATTSITWAGGGGVGNRYSMAMNAFLDANGGSGGYPANAAGATASGGQIA